VSPCGAAIQQFLARSALQLVSAVIKFGAGLALLCLPSMTVELLLGTRLERHPSHLPWRTVAGVALLTLSGA
jgi:hypothetical protein